MSRLSVNGKACRDHGALLHRHSLTLRSAGFRRQCAWKDTAQHVEAHGDLEVGRDADEIAVEGGVVELAEREAVGNDRLPQRMAVGEDVSGFQQLAMAEPADGAAAACRGPGRRAPRRPSSVSPSCATAYTRWDILA